MLSRISGYKFTGMIIDRVEHEGQEGQEGQGPA